MVANVVSNYGARGAKLNIDLKSVIPWTFASAKNSAKNRKLIIFGTDHTKLVFLGLLSLTSLGEDNGDWR